MFIQTFMVPLSWLWRKCNWLLRLGRPWGAVTLSRWYEGWYILGNEVPGGALSLALLTTQTMVTTGSSPYKENSHGRAGNQTRDLVISSQKLWPLDHEAGRTVEHRNILQHVLQQKEHFMECDLKQYWQELKDMELSPNVDTLLRWIQKRDNHMWSNLNGSTNKGCPFGSILLPSL